MQDIALAEKSNHVKQKDITFNPNKRLLVNNALHFLTNCGINFSILFQNMQQAAYYAIIPSCTYHMVGYLSLTHILFTLLLCSSACPDVWDEFKSNAPGFNF